MPPLITRDEARRLGEIEDRAEIEALVERAWRARLDRFGDATDMRSLVNAKSGGCAEDRGFCVVTQGQGLSGRDFDKVLAGVRLWNPAAQLRFRRKPTVPRRPDGAPNRGHGRPTREHDDAVLAGAADPGHGGPQR